MSLGSGTPVTSWPAEPTSSELVNGFNRIEGNIQDIEDSKVENASGGGGEVDLSQSSDSDVAIDVASDAALTWDETEDKFTAGGKDIAAPILGDTATQSKGNTIANNARWTPAAGMYQIVFEAGHLGVASANAVLLEVYVNSGWVQLDIAPSSFVVGRAAWALAIITDGTNVRVFNNNSGDTITVHYVRFTW
jgi:hypothetical protein